MIKANEIMDMYLILHEICMKLLFSMSFIMPRIIWISIKIRCHTDVVLQDSMLKTLVPNKAVNGHIEKPVF